MDRQVLDAMRLLQSGSVGPEVLAEVRKLVGALRARRVLDATATGEILALLLQWSAAVDPAVRLEAMQWGSRLTDDDEMKSQLLRQAGETLLASYNDVDGAISHYEMALDADVDMELMVDLGNLYVSRGAEGDEAQAAALYTAIGEFLGDEDGAAFLHTALDLVPGHTEALDTLEALVPEAERARELSARWRAYLEAGQDEERRARCTMALASAKAAEGLLEDALEMLDPLWKAGHGGAKALRHDMILAADAHSPASRPPKVPASAPQDAAVVFETRADATEVDAVPPFDSQQLPAALADPDPDLFDDAATSVMPEAPLIADAARQHAQSIVAAQQGAQRPTAQVHSTHAAVAADPTVGVRQPRGGNRGWPWIVASVLILGLAVGGGLWVIQQRRVPAQAVPPAIPPATAPAAPAPPAAAPPQPAAVVQPATQPQPQDAGQPADAGATGEAVAEQPTGALGEDEGDPAALEDPSQAAATERTDIVVRAALEHARLRGGKMDRDKLEQSMQAMVGDLQACYDEGIARRPKLRGRVVMQWHVRRTGKVSGLRKVRSSLQDARVHRCIKDAIQAATFNKPRGKPALLRVPFDFTQPKGRR